MGETRKRPLRFCFFVLVFVLLSDSTLADEDEREQEPKFDSSFPLNFDFANSSGGKLTCKASGHPQPIISWLMLDNSPVTHVPRLRQTTTDGNLVFYPFAAEDYREDVHGVSYKCAATNILGTVVSHDIKVKGVVQQSFDVHVYDVYAMRGNTAVVRCHIPKFLQNYVSVTAWIKDSVASITLSTLDSNSKYTILPSGELLIKEVDISDGHTTYRCQVTHRLTNELKTSRNQGRLFVTDSEGKFPPKIVFSQSEINTEVGKHFSIPCVAYGNPSPKYFWSKQSSSKSFDNIQINGRIKLMAGSLVFENVRPMDAGTYICTAANEISSDKVVIQVKITEPLSVVVTPTHRVVDANQAISISCKVTGSPVHSIIWLKDGKPLSGAGMLKSTNVSIQIPNMSMKYAGIYQCLAENDFYTSYGISVVKLGATVLTIAQGFEEQTLKPNDKLIIGCTAEGNPTLQIQWKKDNFDLPVQERFRVCVKYDGFNKVTSSLEVTNLKVEDGGVYFCFATTEKGQVFHAAKINVEGELGARSNIKYKVIDGNTVHMDCPIYGYPILNVKWTRNGRNLPFNIRQFVFKNGSLVISDVEIQIDSGKYVCSALGTNRNIVKGEVELIVMVPPKVTPFSFQDELIREGARARIQCVIREGQSPIKITWLRDGQLIASDQGILTRDIDEFSSILMISSVNPRHNGNYTCKATNAAGSAQHTAPLFVNVPPRLTIEQDDVTISAGKVLFLHCQVEGFPKPIISWKRAASMEDLAGGISEQLENSDVSHIFNNGTLMIEHVQRSDEGLYICIADNGIQKPLTNILSVKIQGAPEFKQSNLKIVASKGTEVEIPCEASGNWPISYEWSVNDNVIRREHTRYKTIDIQNEGTASSISTLRISWVDRKDSTTFVCIAKNEIGERVMKIDLFVQEDPSAPTNVSIVKVVNKTIEVKWSMPHDGNSAIKRYYIQYKKEEERWEDKMKSITTLGTITIAKLNNLKPATVYNIRIKAENEIGNSSFSETISAETDENVPEGPPEAVDVESMDVNALRVSWKPPQKRPWNGTIRGYNIGYKVHGSPDAFTYMSLEVPDDYTDELIYRLTELHMYTQYDVVVQAFNSKGVGPKSEVVLAMTTEDIPNSPPVDVRCSSLSSKSIYALWESPAPETINGILRGYKILFKPVDEWYDTMIQSKIVETTKATITDLNVNTNYSIQVLAFTKMGDGIKSTPIYCKTHEDVPGPPELIKVLPSSPDSVVVAWKPPHKASGALVKYNIYYKPIANGDQVNLDTQRTDELQHNASFHQSHANNQYVELKGLEKNKKYAFWVTATSAIGESSASSPVVVQTVADSIVAAKIASFDGIIKAPWQEDIVLPCPAVGVPEPNRKWTIGDYPLEENNRLQIKSDGSVVINKVSSEDSGNYTCAVYNEYGRDEVSYMVAVQVPPSAPIVDVISKSRTSIKLQLRPGLTTDESIRGYLLHLKKDNEVWNTVELRSGQASYTLENLMCGATYHIYMEAFNNIGTGLPSDTLIITMDGADVIQPKKDQIIREGSTFVTVHLESWPSTGCSVKSFTVQYKPMRGGDWTTAGSAIRPTQKKLVISGLNPATWYVLRLTVDSTNKTTTADYKFATLTLTGGTLAPDI